MNQREKNWQRALKDLEYIHKQVWLLDGALDAPCFRNNKQFRANPKWWSKWKQAVSALRKIEPYFTPPTDYTLFRWILDHHSGSGYTQRYQWRKWKRLRQKGIASLTGETELERVERIKQLLNNDRKLSEYADAKV